MRQHRTSRYMIALNFPGLPLRERRRIVTALRHKLIPPGKPGRKRSKEIAAAYADWQAGMRGLPLYRKHVSGFDRMGYWKRKAKTRALMDAIRSRRRRERRQPLASIWFAPPLADDFNGNSRNPTFPSSALNPSFKLDMSVLMELRHSSARFASASIAVLSC